MNKRRRSIEVRTLILKKFALLIFYTLIHIYLLVFNWNTFILSLKVNLGFGVLKFPPFIVPFLVGFLIILALSWVNYMNSLRKIIAELEEGVQLGQDRNQLVRKKIKEHLTEEKSMEQLKNRMGIAEIQKKQEEMTRLLSALQAKLDKKDEAN